MQLHDTAARAVREFTPITPGQASVYLCGATVQAPPHIGHLRSAVVFDVLSLVFHTSAWSQVSYWLIAVGVITGLIAAPFGFIDWLGIPSRTRAKRVGAAIAFICPTA